MTPPTEALDSGTSQSTSSPQSNPPSQNQGQPRERTVEQLVTLARARLGRISSHPGAIEVSARDGKLLLRGLALAQESERILSELASIPGVQGVDNQMTALLPSEAGARVSAYMGPEPESLQPQWAGSWSSEARWAVGALSALFFGLALRNRGTTRLLLGGLAAGGILRALSNQSIPALVSAIFEPIVRLRRSIEVQAPVDDVYDFWLDFSNYARFMSYVREVGVNEQGGLRWTLVGPMGTRVSGNARVKAMVHNQRVAWESKPGSLFYNSGDIRFVSRPDGTTRVDVEISYAPRAGALGQAVVRMLGYDPADKIDEDLRVMKTLIEGEPELRHETA